MIGLFVLLGLVAGGRCFGQESLNINGAVDELLEAANAATRASGKTTHALPDHYQVIYHQIVFWFHGFFEVQQGTVGDLSTLRRTGEARLDLSGDVLRVTVPLGLADLWAKYRRTQVKLIAYSAGELDVRCSGDSLSVTLRLELRPRRLSCGLSLESATFQRLGKCSVSTTGGGLMNTVRSTAQGMVNHLSSNYVSQINSHLKSLLNKELSQFDFCKHL